MHLPSNPVHTWSLVSSFTAHMHSWSAGVRADQGPTVTLGAAQIKFYLSWSLALTAFFIAAQITVLAVLGNGNYIVQVGLLTLCIGFRD